MLIELALMIALHHARPIPSPPHLDGPPRRSVMIEYRVERGDTLWSIARAQTDTRRPGHLDPMRVDA